LNPKSEQVIQSIKRLGL